MAPTRIRFREEAEEEEDEEDAGHCGYCDGGLPSVRRERFSACSLGVVAIGTVYVRF